MSKDDWVDLWKTHKIRVVLGALIFFGVVGVLLFEQRGVFPFRFLEHLFMAFAVAGFIALIIELTLQRQLVRNAFEAAIGYLLRDELKGELRWIYGLDLLCEKHIQHVSLKEIPETQLVIARSTVIRTFRNISDKEIPIPLNVAIDEWFHEGFPSNVISFRYQHDGQPQSNNLATTGIKKTDAGLAFEAVPTQHLKRGQRITLSFEVEETKQRNDWMFVTFSTPTANPTVTVDAPESIEIGVAFDHRNAGDLSIKKGERTWQLDGMMLPRMDIRIRWYDKERSKQWLQ